MLTHLIHRIEDSRREVLDPIKVEKGNVDNSVLDLCVVPACNWLSKDRTTEKEMNPIGIEKKRCLLIACLGVDAPRLLLLLLSCVEREKNARWARYKVGKSQWEKILLVTAKLPYDRPCPTPVD